MIPLWWERTYPRILELHGISEKLVMPIGSPTSLAAPSVISWTRPQAFGSELSSSSSADTPIASGYTLVDRTFRFTLPRRDMDTLKSKESTPDKASSDSKPSRETIMQRGVRLHEQLEREMYESASPGSYLMKGPDGTVSWCQVEHLAFTTSLIDGRSAPLVADVRNPCAEVYLSSSENVITLTDQESITMSNSVVASKAKKAVRMTKSDVTKASVQVASRQLVKALRAPISGILAAKFGGSSKRSQQKIVAFLESPEGLGMLKYILGVGLAASPLAQYKESTLTGGTVVYPVNRLAEVADYLRVEGMTDLGDSFSDLLTGPLFKGIESTITTITELAAAPAMLTSPETKIGWEETVETAEKVPAR